MEDLTNAPGFAESLDACPDDELRAVIDRANTLLAARETERRKQALAQIQQLAKAHGLAVAVKHPARKRGRPPKADRQA